MPKVLLISAKYITDNSHLDSNVDYKLLSKTIDDCQQIYLKPILGIELFNSLIDVAYDNATGNITIPNVYVVLLAYVKNYLVNRVVVDFIVPNNFRLTNKGIQKLNDTSSTGVSTADMESLKDYYGNLSNTYKEQLIEYIVLNKLNDVADKIQITSDAAGWFFGDTPFISTTAVGATGATGLTGAAGINGQKGETFTFIQNTPSVVWNIIHNLGFFPNVVSIDSGGNKVEGDVKYVDLNSLTLTFVGGFSGTAYMS